MFGLRLDEVTLVELFSVSVCVFCIAESCVDDFELNGWLCSVFWLLRKLMNESARCIAVRIVLLFQNYCVV